MSKRHFSKTGCRLAIALVLALPMALLAQAQNATNRPPAPRRPNIVFILADDLGYGDLGCYGQQRIKTPNIDALASNGMRFTSFYAGSTVCAPSRCALMTGKNTGHSRIRGNSTVPLQADDFTVAELLKNAGYATCAIGKWGLGEMGTSGVPGKKGFDEWFGYLNQVEAHNYYPPFLNRTSSLLGEKQVQLNENGKSDYSPDLFTDAAMNFIHANQPKFYNHYRPFFLYLAYTIPHANNELGYKTGNGMEIASDSPYSGELWPQVERNKAAMITMLDEEVGKVVAKLKEYKLETNTIIIFSSDNGPHKEGGADPKFFQSSGQLRGIKRDLYEGGIRVPFIVSWPARIKPGTASDMPAAFWDFMPTAAQMASQSEPTNIDGISFLPTLIGQKQTNIHEFLYWEFPEDGFKQAVRMGDWKGVRFGVDGPLELYNLKTDLAEKNDVAEKNPDVVKKIEEYLKTARTEDPQWPTKTAAQTPKKEYAEQKGSYGDPKAAK